MKTIDELARKWCSIFDRIVNSDIGGYDLEQLIRSLNLNITKHEYCVVGEAHGWTCGYGIERYEHFFCKKCHDFAGNTLRNNVDFIMFFHLLQEYRHTNWREQDFIKRFELHMVKHQKV